MVDLFHADKNHVAEGIEKLINRSFEDNDAELTVYDGDPVMKGITLEEKRERNLTGYEGESICGFHYDGTRLTVRIHESKIERTFTLDPAGPDGIDVNQASDIKLIAPKVADLLDQLEEEYDIISYDFTEVSAASISGGGHFCDFEFEYVVTSTSF